MRVKAAPLHNGNGTRIIQPCVPPNGGKSGCGSPAAWVARRPRSRDIRDYSSIVFVRSIGLHLRLRLNHWCCGSGSGGNDRAREPGSRPACRCRRIDALFEGADPLQTLSGWHPPDDDQGDRAPPDLRATWHSLRSRHSRRNKHMRSDVARVENNPEGLDQGWQESGNDGPGGGYQAGAR